MFWQQLVICTVLRRRKNHFKNQNSCFFFKSHKASVCKPLFTHVSNAFSQQPSSYWKNCGSLNLSETKTLILCIGENINLKLIVKALIKTRFYKKPMKYIVFNEKTKEQPSFFVKKNLINKLVFN